MYSSAIKATLLFEDGKPKEAIDYLEKFVSNAKKNNLEVIQAHEYLVRFKSELKLDISQHVKYLLNCSALDLFGDTLFSIGIYLIENDDKDLGVKYLNTISLCVGDVDDYAEQMGFLDKWLEVKHMTVLNKSKKNDENDIFLKCNFGETIEVLTPEEQIFVLCTGFVEEVNSGGFEAYFSTGYSKHCVKTVEYLEQNKSKIYPRMLKKAITLFPEDFDFSDPLETENYLDEHEKILDKFEKLEEKIYESTEDIDAILERLKEQIK